MTAVRPLDIENALAVGVDAGAIARFVAALDLDRLEPVRPSWNSDLEWLSTANRKQFRAFEHLFETLDVAAPVLPMLDLIRAPRLYSGFILRRQTCEAPDFHTDWTGCNRQAWTFIAPISDISPDFGLILRQPGGGEVPYAYCHGEGILFGDEVLHSTRPGRSEHPVMLLCFEFGTDRMEYWPAIHDCISTQSVMTQRPDGRFVVSRSRFRRWLSRCRKALTITL